MLQTSSCVPPAVRPGNNGPSLRPGSDSPADEFRIQATAKLRTLLGYLERAGEDPPPVPFADALDLTARRLQELAARWREAEASPAAAARFLAGQEVHRDRRS